MTAACWQYRVECSHTYLLCRHLDTNGDGLVSELELRAALTFNTVPLRRHLDTNGDGLVSELELRAALGELGAGGHASAAAQELVGLAGGGGGGGGARGVSFAEWSLFVRRVRFIMPVCKCLEQAILQHRERKPCCI